MELLTPREVADILRLSPAAVYALCDSGAIRSHRVGVNGGRRRIPRKSVDEYLSRTAVGMPGKRQRNRPAAVLMDFDKLKMFGYTG
jgi:excisionase family DNA binding protein